MTKIKVTICTGTACYVMGGGELMMLEEALPMNAKEHVELIASPCLGYCNSGKDDRSHAPYVLIDDEVILDATLSKVIELILAKLEK